MNLMKLITFNKLIGFFFILATSLMGEELNFLINPKRFHIDTTKESINEMEVYNDGDKVLKIIIYKESGKDKDQEDLSPNLEIYPKSLILKPQTGSRVKFLYSPSKNQRRDRKYKAYIFLKELPTKEVQENLENKDLIFCNEVGISIYGN